MIDLQHLSEISLERAEAWVNKLDALLNEEEDTDSQVAIVRAGTRLLEMVLDRTIPKITKTRNENVTFDMAKVFSAFPKKLLSEIEEHYSQLQEPKHVESESSPGSGEVSAGETE